MLNNVPNGILQLCNFANDDDTDMSNVYETFELRCYIHVLCWIFMFRLDVRL